MATILGTIGTSFLNKLTGNTPLDLSTANYNNAVANQINRQNAKSPLATIIIIIVVVLIIIGVLALSLNHKKA